MLSLVQAGRLQDICDELYSQEVGAAVLIGTRIQARDLDCEQQRTEQWLIYHFGYRRTKWSNHTAGITVILNRKTSTARHMFTPFLLLLDFLQGAFVLSVYALIGKMFAS